MAQIQANQVQICLFWHDALNYNDVETTWPPEMRTMWNAFGNAIINLRQRHGNSLPVEMYVCPVTIADNAVVVNQNGLDFSLLPAAQVYATYADGTASNFFLSKNLAERFSGINWQTSDVQPYIEALLYRSKAADQSLLCKLFPPLCSVGGYVWLALAAGATLKASDARGFARGAWGTGAAILWKEWYDRGGLAQLKQTVGIGAIFPNIPELYKCNDGTYSTSSTSRACHRHGGRKSANPVSFGGGGSGLLNIQDVPLSKIHINRELFQGREKAYSKRSVDNIVEDAMSGRFAWENLDPITLWSAPDGRLYLLSGHSRHKAFEILAAEGIKVDGKGFDKIPAKIRTGSLESAQRMALESNTLSTKETDIERAAYYRRLRQDGEEERKLLAAIRKNEGRNWSNIYAYTFLSPSGKAWATLQQFAEGEDQSTTLAKALAKWIGTARREFPMLTNEHEAEIFSWLFEHRGYGTGSGQVSNERDFMEKMATVVQKNTYFGQFDPSRPLNILQAQLKSPVEIEYDRAIQEKSKQISDLEREIKLKIKSLTDRQASREDIARIIQPMETGLRNLRVELSRLLQKKSEIIEYSKQEATLFGHRRHSIGRRYPFI